MFTGARYGDGALAYYELLCSWRSAGDMAGMNGPDGGPV